eukprot:3171703-Amphidinium_carterae.1
MVRRFRRPPGSPPQRLALEPWGVHPEERAWCNLTLHVIATESGLRPCIGMAEVVLSVNLSQGEGELDRHWLVLSLPHLVMLS